MFRAQRGLTQQDLARLTGVSRQTNRRRRWLAFGVLLAGSGRLVSISKVGLPKPAALWLGYLVPELLLPFVIAGAHSWGG